MLFGAFENTMDEKGRMILPTKFRGDFQGKCMLTHGLDGCIYAYTLEGWERFVGAMDELPEDDKKVRRLLRYYYGGAEECDIDRQGRMTVPAAIRERVGLGKEIVTVGVSKRVEIWDRAAFRKENLDGDQLAEFSNYVSTIKSGVRSAGPVG
ncbi:MAG: division/cell wall cluster transcriptional repressor MraZ [Clostridiales Family XIII bacterium]|jgi:MraZ protein|nr:division/cell wall cluster transcriptional repressor MraZ [Clostridiales Family XIII bacterium]